MFLVTVDMISSLVRWILSEALDLCRNINLILFAIFIIFINICKIDDSKFTKHSRITTLTLQSCNLI